MQMLIGRVFHATTGEAFKSIKADGEIRLSLNGRYPAPFGEYDA